MEEYIGNVKLNYKYYSGVDEYSDGEIEDELLDIVQNNDEKNYNYIISRKKSWPIMYHLSHIRTNIFDVVDFKGNENVLEIGAGCGAVTGKIADNVKKVTCVELSKKRSMINAYRNKNRNNIEIMVGNFEKVQESFAEKFDYITLIGVFEYAQYYINSKKPYDDFLQMIRSHLKKDGKIIIAIENKFGMKYWAGCKEDHINEFFVGIEGYNDVDRAKTFSNVELKNMLIENGLNHFEFFYPYPDYKFPLCIYSDTYLPKSGCLTNNMKNYDNDRLFLFDEGLAFDNILESNMFPFFSNSFLIICGREDVV